MKLNFLKKKKPVEVIIPEDKYYQMGKYSLKLKHYHQLENFQSTYPLYDRFLPIICSDLNGLIIDIGANIGDTSIAIFAKNDNAFIIGIEPDLEFFDDCLENINSNGLNDRFFGINKFVTSKSGNYVIKRSDSIMTGSLETSENEDENENNSLRFEDIFELYQDYKNKSFDLLKIDTDGFDWDILNTFYDYSKKSNYLPKYIHFEMQTFINNEQHEIGNRDEIIKNYMNSIAQLNEIGYTNFCLFDNFGTHLKITKSIEEISELVQYLKRSQLINNYSTIYYFDVLAFKDEELSNVHNKLNILYNK